MHYELFYNQQADIDKQYRDYEAYEKYEPYENYEPDAVQEL